tara:strand:- start:1558 stop:2193 length:636 start_codon:yes stop_codon:yes gene_type:complete
MNGGKIDILRPFGPSIAKLEIPDNIIKSLNEYAEKVILDEAKLEKLDNGKNLAGNVKQEFILEQEILESSGFFDFLKLAVSKWIEASDSKKITLFEIKKSWIVRQFENEYNPIHYHSGHISGVGYLKIPNDFGKTVQKNKKKNENGRLNFIHGNRMFNSSSIFSINPKVGEFWLFPNYLMHTVYPFYGNEERRSVSFNANIDKEIYNVFGR